MRSVVIARFLLIMCAMSVFVSQGTYAVLAAERIDFNRDIRPILSEACFQCHGPDQNQRKANLRLDTAAGLRGEGEAAKVIVPGKPDDSELILRVLATDPAEQMPPADSGKTLTEAQKELLRRWIAEGAEYRGHWAYIAPVKPAVPMVPGNTFVRNHIDQFLLATMLSKGVQPSPATDPVTLVRRLSFDLTGLPPTPERVAAFVRDPSPAAYEALVDELLASPEYGERMAMAWLDQVRYADTNGYHGDNHEDRDLYRDWVIRSFNSNRPFNEFTTEQIAGDLLPNATADQRVASGYNRLLMTTREGGAQAKEYLAKYSADRVRNVSSVWMASTMGCCECHDHKFDPFSQRDFYQMAAFFADIQEVAVGEQPGTRIPTEQQSAQLTQLDQQLTAAREAAAAPQPHLAAAQLKWESQALAELSQQPALWNTPEKMEAESLAGATLKTEDDRSILSTGENPAKDIYRVKFAPKTQTITGVKLEALQHPSLPGNGLSRSNGNFVLTHIEISLLPQADAAPVPLKIASAVADFSQEGFPIAHAFDGGAETGWAVSGHTQKANRKAVFLFEKAVEIPEGAQLQVVLKHESVYAAHNIGRFRLSTTTRPQPDLSDNLLPEPVIAALKISAEQRTADQMAVLAAHYRPLDPVVQKLEQAVAQLTEQRKQLEASFRTTLISMSGPPRMIRVLPRGNWLDDTGEIVPGGAPSFLLANMVREQSTGTAEPRGTRLDLARWLTAPDNPLVSRVFVNRLWKQTFGQGLVKSLEDFGSQGNWPSHPELLDWLALDFQEHNWDIKRTLKLMVMSGAYQQSSVVSEALQQSDPFNSLVARQGRFRHDAEVIRDNALLTSGLLRQTVGGPSVKPYQPPGYWSYLNFPMREWQNDSGDALYRRGLYTYWCRTFLHPSLKAFDAPTREECTVERARSNTPLQALALLNDPTYVEAARKLAERLLEHSPEIGPRIEHAYQIVLSRPARPEELKILTQLYHRHREQFAENRAAAEQVLRVGASPVATSADLADLAAMTSLTRVIYNLHETISRN